MKHRTHLQLGISVWLSCSALGLALLGSASSALAQDEAPAEERLLEELGEGEEGEPAEAQPPAEEAPAAEEPAEPDVPEEAEAQQPAPEPEAEEAEAAKAPAKPPKAAAAPEEPAPEPAEGVPEPRDEASGQTLVTRLPYWNAPMIRGIKFGSLIRIWHGYQFPHYARSGIPISGDVWVDTGYQDSERGLDTDADRRFWIQQGRFKLRVTPTYTKGSLFVQGQGELLAWVDPIPGNTPIDVDDAWIKFGVWDTFDVQVGRFEGWQVYHKGMGLDLYTVEWWGAMDPEIEVYWSRLYEVGYMYYRQDQVGQLALHFYPAEFLRFELGGVVGNQVGLNRLGARPVGILDLGWMKLKVGAEYRLSKDDERGTPTEEEHRGFGAALQFIVDPVVEFGVNVAYSMVDVVDAQGRVNELGSITPLSYGGFLNGRPIGDLVLGVGVHQTVLDDRQRNLQTGVYGHREHLQTFGAIQHPIISDDLTAKLVVAYAEADLRPAVEPWRVNTAMSYRLRLNYDF